MSLKEVADLATALTLLVAAGTFIFAVFEHRQRERDKRTQNWQRVVVFKIIQDGVSDFDEIKLRYVAEAQQLLTFSVPKREIQDDALQVALMSLIADRLISISSEDGRYLLNAVSTAENQMKAMAMTQVQRQMSLNRIVSKLYETLENDSGKYTIDQLYRVLGAEPMGYSFEDFDVLVRDKIDRGLFVMNQQNQKLWLRARVPQQSSPSPKPQPQQAVPPSPSSS